MMKSLIMSAVATVICVLVFGATVHFGARLTGKRSFTDPPPETRPEAEKPAAAPDNAAGPAKEEPLPVPGDFADRLERALEKHGLVDPKSGEVKKADLAKLLAGRADGRYIADFLGNRVALERRLADLDRREKTLRALVQELKEDKQALIRARRSFEEEVKAHKERVTRWNVLVAKEEKLRKNEGFDMLFEQLDVANVETAAADLRTWLFGDESTTDDHLRAILILRRMEASKVQKILETFEPKERKSVLLEMTHQGPLPD